MQTRAVILVEGRSDQAAVVAMARKGKTSLEGIKVVAMGGASNTAAHLRGAQGLRVAGLYDAREVGYVRRAIERVGLLPRYTDSRAALEESEEERQVMEELGFFRCDQDLEDELIRALGPENTVALIEEAGELKAFRSLQQQPGHRDRPLTEQLHRFVGSRSGRKIRYARLLVESLDHAPRPLDGVLRHVRG